MFDVVEIHGMKYKEYPKLFGKHIYIQSDLTQPHREHLHHFLEKQGEEWVRARVGERSDKHFKMVGYTGFYEMVWRDGDDMLAILVHEA